MDQGTNRKLAPIHFFLELSNILCDKYRQIGQLGPVHPNIWTNSIPYPYVQQTSNILKSSLLRRIAVTALGISGLKFASFGMPDLDGGQEG